MRHRRTVKTLGRTSAHRKATLANLSSALLVNKHIQTTEAKAKAARRFTERLITLAKQATVHARRIASRRLRQKDAVKVLFEEVAPRYKDRNGGYTRVVKLGQRSGDGAPMAVVELVGFETAVKKQKDKQAKAEAKAKKEAKKGTEKTAGEESAKEAKAAKPEKAAKESKKQEKKQDKKASAKESPKAGKDDKKSSKNKKEKG
jgi:large subunit ribosomal protein L17